MRKTKRIFTVIVLILIISMTLWAKGQEETGTQQAVPKEVGKIPAGTYYVMIGGENAKDYIDPVTGSTMKGWETLMKPLIDANPGVKIEFVEVPWSSYIVKLETGIESGEFDVVHLAGGQNQVQGSRGNLLNLNEFLSKDVNYDPAKVFGESFWNSAIMTLGDQHLSMPKSGYTFTHIIDTELFKQAGVPLPPDNPTYQDLYKAAKAIHGKTDKNGNKIFGAFEWAPYETFRALMILKTKRVDWLAKWPVPEILGGDLTKLTWDLTNIRSEIKETISEMKAFAELMPPGWNNREGAENFFTAKNNIGILLNTDSGGKFKNLYDAGDLSTLSRYKVYPYPVAEIDGKKQLAVAGNVHTWGAPITAKNPQASYEIMKYLASEEVQKENYTARWLAPILPDGIAFLNPADPLSKVSMEALQLGHGGERYAKLSVWSQLFPMVRDSIMFKGLLENNPNLDAEIDKVQKYLDDWLVNAIKTGTR
ncbi:MAG: extracellular solute-binding protein [Sphaerochaetaceae bacterium]|nr:extracellular solute-binding protein [Sphaerochaetaceae bacterium]